MTDNQTPGASMTDQTPSPQSVVVPKFGDIVENGWASEDNPTRRGFFVREFKRTGKLNPGRTWEITDGKGKFWEFKPSDIGERLSVSAAPAPSSLAGGEVRALDRHELAAIALNTGIAIGVSTWPDEQMSDALAVTDAILAALSEAPAEAKGEAFPCRSCGGSTRVWFAPNDLWNRVVGSPEGFLCPNCFIDRAEAGGVDVVWRVAPAEGAGETENPGGYLIKDFADGWFWTPHRIAATAALTDGHAVYDLRARSSAPEAREVEAS